MTIIDISSKRDLNKYINNNKSNYKTFCFITSEKDFCKSFNEKINSLTENITNFNGGIIFTKANIDKGNLSIGNDADLCIVDIDKPWIVKKDKLISKSKNTSIEDKKLQGRVTNTFVKGKELFKL